MIRKNLLPLILIITCACSKKESFLSEAERKFILDNNIWIHSKSWQDHQEKATNLQEQVTSPKEIPAFEMGPNDTAIHIRRGEGYIKSIVTLWSARNDRFRVKKIMFDGIDSIPISITSLFSEVRIIRILGKAGLKGISGFKKLEKISFRHSHFPYPPDELPELKKLRFLYFQNGNTNSLPLGKLQSLETLWLKGCGLPNYSDLNGLHNLRRLELRRIGSNDSLCNLNLKNMPYLKKLAISGRFYDHLPQGIENCYLEQFVFQKGNLSKTDHLRLLETNENLLLNKQNKRIFSETKDLSSN